MAAPSHDNPFESPSGDGAKKGAEGEEQKEESKGIPPAIFWGASAGVILLMAGAGFATAYFAIPGTITSTFVKEGEVVPAEHGEGGDAHGADSGHGKEKDAADHAAKEEHGAKKEEHGAKKEEKGGHAKKEEHGGKKEEKGGHGKGEHGEEEAKPVDPMEKGFLLSELYVNVAKTRGSRVLKVSLYVEANEEVKIELEENRPQVVDIVSSILASKTMDELTATESRGLLREEIARRLNAILGLGDINNVYFIDFIIN